MSEELNVVGYLHKNSVGVRILSREATIMARDEGEGWSSTPLVPAAELTTLRAQNAALVDKADHWEKVARSTNAKLGIALEAVMGVVSAIRQYLPPDGISQHECINLVIGATDNPRINPLILTEDACARNDIAQVVK